MGLVKIEIKQNDFKTHFYLEVDEVKDLYENINHVLEEEYKNGIGTQEEFDNFLEDLNMFHTFYTIEKEVEEINLKLI